MERMTPRLKVAVAVLTLALLGLSIAVTAGTMSQRSRQLRHVEPAAAPELDSDAAARRLATALRFRTASRDAASRSDSAARASDDAFRDLRSYLAEAFPATHATLRREPVGRHSLLYTWPGRDPDRDPILLAAHMDVVPADTGGGSRWTHPPFDGVIAEGYIWGRGALDDKVGVLGILEAVEMLLEQGYRPERTVYLAFGHDEEVGGHRGAAAMARVLESRGVRLEYVLDEGLAIVRNLLPGLSSAAALIGIAEKGGLTIELTARAPGGHSSMPPAQTATGILNRAIVRLQQNPLPAALEGPARSLFEYLGPEMTLPQRAIFANLWLFEPLVERRLAQQPGANALIRTTTAVTLLRAGVKANVLPGEARATLNFRVRPGETTEDVIDHVYTVIDDPRVRLQVVEARDPSPISSIDSPAFRALHRSVRQVFPDLVVAPSLVLGGTDGRHYQPIARDVYRFLPIVLGPEDLTRIHGVDERIAVRSYADVIRFYLQLIRNTAS